MAHLRILAVASGIAILAAQTADAQQTAASASGTTAPAALAPDVGQMAPDFTLPWADSAGVRPAPVKLSDLRGKVVVIAFYPADRTTGCTAEMTKFRDEYTTLFGENVVVLPVSGDGLESHASWARDMKMPFALVSDVGLSVAELYGSKPAPNPARPGTPRASRNTFVVGKDGRIAWRKISFQALVEAAYTTLAEEVAKARAAND
jgi:peroxiredoxin Q/BCP